MSRASRCSSRAPRSPHECDLVVEGHAQRRGARLALPAALDNFQSDRAAEAPLTDAQLRQLAAAPGQELTYTCVPPGSGRTHRHRSRRGRLLRPRRDRRRQRSGRSGQHTVTRRMRTPHPAPSRTRGRTTSAVAMSALRANGGPLPLPLAAIALLLPGACSRSQRPPLNVVLISLDTLRADRMSRLWGRPPHDPGDRRPGHTRRALHASAFSPSPWTLPAHASMLTGRYPSSLSPNFTDPLYRLAPLLSTMLKDHGYRTAAVTGGGFVSKAFGADVGFDSFAAHGNVHHGTPSEWIEPTQADRPFFLVLPHLRRPCRRISIGATSGTATAASWPTSTSVGDAARRPLSTRRSSAVGSRRRSREAVSARPVRWRRDGSRRAGREGRAALQRDGLLERTHHRDHQRSRRGVLGPHQPRGAITDIRSTMSCSACRSSGTSPGLSEPGSAPVGAGRPDRYRPDDHGAARLCRADGRRRRRPQSAAGRKGVERDRTLFAEAVRHGPPRRGVISARGRCW